VEQGIVGTVALVTGAGWGVGAAVATALAEAGATVAVADRNTESAYELAAILTGAGGRGLAFPLDVTDPAEVDGAVRRVERELGPLGLLVNAAGLVLPGELADYPDEDWARTFAVNATGVFHACRAAARCMIPRRAGAIVTVVAAPVDPPQPDLAAHAAATAAAARFTVCLGQDLAGYGIRCNVVSVGATPPADAAEAVLFLASGAARRITMHDLRVAGGGPVGVTAGGVAR
jgi:2,3-dihydro-2,3-dihydroxybenzoate dehydrogenase